MIYYNKKKAGEVDDALMEGVAVVVVTEAGEADEALMEGVAVVVPRPVRPMTH